MPGVEPALGRRRDLRASRGAARLRRIEAGKRVLRFSATLRRKARGRGWRSSVGTAGVGFSRFRPENVVALPTDDRHPSIRSGLKARSAANRRSTGQRRGTPGVEQTRGSSGPCEARSEPLTEAGKATSPHAPSKILPSRPTIKAPRRASSCRKPAHSARAHALPQSPRTPENLVPPRSRALTRARRRPKPALRSRA